MNFAVGSETERVSVRYPIAVANSAHGFGLYRKVLVTPAKFHHAHKGPIHAVNLSGTCSTLSAIVNGVATILMTIIIDPQLSVMTDDVIEGKQSEAGFRRAIVWLVGSRVAGTVLAQALLLPAASLIVFAAEKL